MDLFVSTEWREGDLVFRCGWGMESRMVTAQGRSVYSHVGILHYDSARQEWQVVHAVPGEEMPEYVKTEPVTRFFSPERTMCGAWGRINCSDSIARQAVAYALTKVADHYEFDNQYLLEDTTQLYCTELVWQSYLHQGIDVTSGRRQDVPTFFCKEGKCIFPNDIEKSEATLFVKSLKIKQL